MNEEKISKKADARLDYEIALDKSIAKLRKKFTRLNRQERNAVVSIIDDMQEVMNGLRYEFVRVDSSFSQQEGNKK